MASEKQSTPRVYTYARPRCHYQESNLNEETTNPNIRLNAERMKAKESKRGGERKKEKNRTVFQEWKTFGFYRARQCALQ